EVSGASCGLEIPQEGEFVVFATVDGFQIEVEEGWYYAGLCGGTRSAAAGPPAVEARPYAPLEATDAMSPVVASPPSRAGSASPATEGGDVRTGMPMLVLVLAVAGLTSLGGVVL